MEYLPDEWNSRTNHYVIRDMITSIPNEYDRSMVVVKDERTGIYDVILPGGAMAGGYINLPDGERKMFRVYPEEVMSKDERKQSRATLTVNGIRGMSKDRISLALRHDGAKYVRFYNRSGKLSLQADDSYYEGKTVHEMALKEGKLNEIARIDVSEAVASVNTVLFDKVHMLKDDNNRWFSI